MGVGKRRRRRKVGVAACARMGLGSYKTSLKILRSRPPPVRKMNSRTDLAKEHLKKQNTSSKVVILGLVAKLYETQSELDRVREEADNALDLLYNQVAAVKESLERKQRRLSALLARKEKKIRAQNQVIHKMRTLVELQKFKMKTGTKRKAPLPPNEVDDWGEGQMAKPPVQVTLKRQSQVKGRPKLDSIWCRNLSAAPQSRSTLATVQ